MDGNGAARLADHDRVHESAPCWIRGFPNYNALEVDPVPLTAETLGRARVVDVGAAVGDTGAAVRRARWSIYYYVDVPSALRVASRYARPHRSSGSRWFPSAHSFHALMNTKFSSVEYGSNVLVTCMSQSA